MWITDLFITNIENINIETKKKPSSIYRPIAFSELNTSHPYKNLIFGFTLKINNNY